MQDSKNKNYLCWGLTIFLAIVVVALLVYQNNVLMSPVGPSILTVKVECGPFKDKCVLTMQQLRCYMESRSILDSCLLELEKNYERCKSEAEEQFNSEMSECFVESGVRNRDECMRNDRCLECYTKALERLRENIRACDELFKEGRKRCYGEYFRNLRSCGARCMACGEEIIAVTDEGGD